MYNREKVSTILSLYTSFMQTAFSIPLLTFPTLVVSDTGVHREHAGGRESVDLHWKESHVSGRSYNVRKLYLNNHLVHVVVLVAPCLGMWLCDTTVFNPPDRADDVASDFTLRGLNVQSIHGDRWAATCGSSNEV